MDLAICCLMCTVNDVIDSIKYPFIKETPHKWIYPSLLFMDLPKMQWKGSGSGCLDLLRDLGEWVGMAFKFHNE